MYNKIILAGNLGRDPELRYTPSGQAVVNLNVATSESFTDAQGQRQERTTWWRVSVWGKQAEICNQYLTKGRQVLIEGRMNPDPVSGGPRTYTRQDGSVGASYEVNASTVRFIGAAGNRDGAGAAAGTPDDFGPPAGGMDDIPF
jgi:single-strand DNA-binding protein